MVSEEVGAYRGVEIRRYHTVEASQSSQNRVPGPFEKSKQTQAKKALLEPLQHGLTSAKAFRARNLLHSRSYE